MQAGWDDIVWACGDYKTMWAVQIVLRFILLQASSSFIAVGFSQRLFLKLLKNILLIV
jgi:hypothetical protein